MRKSGSRYGEKTERLTNVPFSTTVGRMFQEQFIFTVCLFRSWNMPRNIATIEYILVGDGISIVYPRTLKSAR